MPAFDIKALIEDDSLQAANGLKSLRFAKSFEVQIDLKSKGLMELTDSGKIWRLVIKSTGAYSLNIIFSDFKLSPKAELFIYSYDKQEVIGALTNRNNQKFKSYATPIVKGDAICIELFEPNISEFSSIAIIGQVSHDYRNIYKIFAEKGTCCGFNQSGSCENNIICLQYSDWQAQGHSVCKLIIYGTEFCSGALVNNTDNNEIPYVLTADHCYSGFNDRNAAANNTIFYFNYDSPTCTSQNGPTNQYISGAVFRANWAPSDFFLEELVARPPIDYSAYYSGWDWNNVIPSSAVGIHHPFGDVKKISISNNTILSTDYASNTSDTAANHWRIIWSSGVTEKGSSGSPLFDQNNRIIGQLHG